MTEPDRGFPDNSRFVAADDDRRNEFLTDLETAYSRPDFLSAWSSLFDPPADPDSVRQFMKRHFQASDTDLDEALAVLALPRALRDRKMARSDLRTCTERMPLHTVRMLGDLEITYGWSAEVNALTFETPWGGHAIVLDQASNLWTRAISMGFTAATFARDPEYRRQGIYLAAVAVGWHCGEPTHGIGELIEELQLTGANAAYAFAADWAQTMYQFILLHELGHVASQHLSVLKQTPSHEQLLVRLGMEMAADDFAVKNLANAWHIRGSRLAPVHLFMGLMALSEQVQPGGAASAHPSWTKRMERLRRRRPGRSVRQVGRFVDLVSEELGLA